jgi:hypothetical protein
MDWKALAGVDTLVFLMAVHNCGAIAQKLIQSGRSPETPAAMIQMAFWHGERVVSGTLETIADLALKHEVKAPATFVVGDVVRLHEKLEGAQRDLQRRSDGSPRFQPAPAPDQLLRIAAGGIGAQVLGWALEIGLFDHLEEPLTAYDLACKLDFNPEATSEILRALVSLGLLESRPDGYRNLELASRYLAAASPFSLRELLLYNCAQLVHWQPVTDFAKRGRLSVEAGRNGELHRAACEAKARFVAPAAVEKLRGGSLGLGGQSAAPPNGVLVIGWGGNAHREALLRRWPGVRVVTCNPLRGDALPGDADCELVILSGILEGGDIVRIDQILNFATAHVRKEGWLMLHDTILPVESLPAPGIALASLAQQIVNPGYRAWSTERLAAVLERRGFAVVRSDILFAGHAVVFATRTQPKPATVAAAD